MCNSAIQWSFFARQKKKSKRAFQGKVTAHLSALWVSADPIKGGQTGQFSQVKTPVTSQAMGSYIDESALAFPL